MDHRTAARMPDLMGGANLSTAGVLETTTRGKLDRAREATHQRKTLHEHSSSATWSAAPDGPASVSSAVTQPTLTVRGSAQASMACPPSGVNAMSLPLHRSRTNHSPSVMLRPATATIFIDTSPNFRTQAIEKTGGVWTRALHSTLPRPHPGTSRHAPASQISIRYEHSRSYASADIPTDVRISSWRVFPIHLFAAGACGHAPVPEDHL